MFTLARPSADQIRSYLNDQQDKPFSYREVKGTAGGPPKGYAVDHNRIRLGHGMETYGLASKAISGWKMFDFDWVQLCWPDAPIVEGTTVAIVVHHYGFWSINSCRIVYLIDNAIGPVRRFGFAYGTLPDHAERGEERFLVEWNQDDNSVWYDVLAFSRPNKLLAVLGYPLTRSLQKRFAIESMQAMTDAVQESK